MSHGKPSNAERGSHTPTFRATTAKMKLLAALACLLCVTSTLVQAELLDPRGARPVEPNTRAEKCASQKEWPFCTDDEWGSKCPSGCRIQGLLNKYDHSLLKKVEKIRSLLEQNKAKHRSADQVSKQTYDYLREKLTLDAGSNNNYYDLAQTLRQRITDMKIKIDRQMRVLVALKDRVKDQVTEMQRLEVDIDIKLRSCKGSCASYSEYRVDQESYVALDKQIQQLGSQSPQNIESVGTLYVMKSRPLQDLVVDSIYKSKGSDSRSAAQQKQDVFSEVNHVQLILEEEGSSSSPATISKVPVCMRLKQQNQDGRLWSPSGSYRKQQCGAKSAVPLCSDDEWASSKCPSGCRLQGLMSQMENEAVRKLWKVCKAAKVYEDAAEKSMSVMTHVYNSNRRLIVSRYVSEVKFVEHAGGWARNLTLLRKRTTSLTQQLKDLSSSIQRQLEDMYRAEVDIDMKLRACRGSCRSALPFDVDHPGYQALQTDMSRIISKAAPPPADPPHIKLQPLDAEVVPPGAGYKSIPAVQRELLTQFEDVGQNLLTVEELLESHEAE